MYRVRFIQKEIWIGYDGPASDTVEVEGVCLCVHTKCVRLWCIPYTFYLGTCMHMLVSVHVAQQNTKPVETYTKQTIVLH